MSKRNTEKQFSDKDKKQNNKRKISKDKIVIWMVIVLIILMFITKQKKAEVQKYANLPDIPADTSLPVENIMSEKLPHLLELGSSSCVPCLMMRPILAELTTEYKGQMVVKFIDVYENPDIARKYNIRGIPTQIFLNSEGKEISRHIGFISKDEILEQWKRLGFSFTPVSTKKENR